MMNKIEVVNDQIQSSSLDQAIEFSFLKRNELFDVNSLKIRVKENTRLEFQFFCEEVSKLDIFIQVDAGVCFSLFEVSRGEKMKIQYRFVLEEDSYTNVFGFHNCLGFQEFTLVDLHGSKARIDYYLKTVSRSDEKYDLTFYHNASETVSQVYTGGVHIQDGSLKFNVTGVVDCQSKCCVVHQKNQIVNLTDHECFIHPNLFIDNNDVEASHSALIGKFDDEVLFYLQRLGLNEMMSLNLLIRGFLMDGLKWDDKREEIIHVIDGYWR